MAGGPHPLWEELAGVLGKGDAFNPEAKHRRWTHFFGSGSTFAAELRSEIQRAPLKKERSLRTLSLEAGR